MGLFSGLRRLVDPIGIFGGRGGGGGGGAPSAPAPDPAMADPSIGMYGDQYDPQYGSFTQPFDVQQFLQYQDPAYYFRLRQGEQSLRNAASAGSGALSGAALKDLLQYGQEMASGEYSNAFNRYQTQQGNIFSRLADIARLGQSSAAGVGSAGTALAGQAGQALQNAGGAYGAGIVGAGNAIGQGATNYWMMDYLNKHPPAGVGGV